MNNFAFIIVLLALAFPIFLSGCKNDQTVLIGDTTLSIELPRTTDFRITDKRLSQVIYTKLLAVEDEFSLAITVVTYFAASEGTPEYADLVDTVSQSLNGCPKGTLVDEASAKIVGETFEAVVCNLGDNRKLEMFSGLLKNHHIIIGVESLDGFNTNELVSTLSFE